jgi:hypothetical protein
MPIGRISAGQGLPRPRGGLAGGADPNEPAAANIQRSGREFFCKEGVVFSFGLMLVSWTSKGIIPATARKSGGPVPCWEKG